MADRTVANVNATDRTAAKLDAPDRNRRAAFAWPVRVYYEDTDAGGIVYYANYLKFFERARTEWLRAAGIDQRALTESDGVLFVVKHVRIDYQAGARLDDELIVRLTVEKLGRASLRCSQQVARIASDGAGGEQNLVSAEIKVGCIGAADSRPRAIPPAVLEKLKNMK